jgi:hypothetical protein
MFLDAHAIALAIADGVVGQRERAELGGHRVAAGDGQPLSRSRAHCA